MLNRQAWEALLLPAIFLRVLFYTLWAASVGWSTELNLQYDFVQAKAAIVAYYLAHGGAFFQYELPVFGAPWSAPYELPIYQLLSAWLHKLSGTDLVSAGRIVAKIFFYLSCVPIALIARALGFRGKMILIPIVLYLASPMYLFWSRQFMNEATATFYSLAYLAAVMEWTRKQRKGRVVLAVLFGIFAAVTKSTTYAGFAFASGLVVVNHIWKPRGFTRNNFVSAGLFLLVPLLFGVAWMKYTDSVKALNPLAAEFTSAALGKWYLQSGWTERFSGGLWNHFFRKTIHDAIGHRGAWIFSVLVAAALGRKAFLYWVCTVLFLVAPLLFTHAHLMHDYYAHANAIFLVFGVAYLVHAAVTSEKKWLAGLGVLLFVVTLTYEVRDFLGRGYYQQLETRSASVDFGKKLKDLVPQGEVMLMYGEDWCPFIPFYAERRALMMFHTDFYSRLPQSLELLKADGKKIGAVVLCYEKKTDEALKKQLPLGPLLLKDVCDVYAYK